MARLALLVFVSTELSVAVALPFSFGVSYGECGPPGLGCLSGGICAQVCGNAWRQFPEVLLTGAVLGLGPALAGLAAVRKLLRGPRGRRWIASHPAREISVAAGFALAGVVFLWGVFPFMHEYMAALLLVFALAVSVPISAAWLGTEWLVRRAQGTP